MVYVMSSMPSYVKSLKEVNDLIFKFLWDNKGDKIKRTEMIADYQDGGLKMLDIIEFNKALKLHGYLSIFLMIASLSGNPSSTSIYLSLGVN